MGAALQLAAQDTPTRLCLYLPDLMLQAYFRRHAEQRGKALAISHGTGAAGLIRRCNALAHHQGIRPGMRQTEALSLCPELLLIAAPRDVYEALRERITELLYGLTPQIEWSQSSEDVLWLGLQGLKLEQGLQPLWHSLDALQVDYRACVGFHRYHTLASCLSSTETQWHQSAEAGERDALCAAVDKLLMLIGNEAQQRNQWLLQRLAVRTLADFVALDDHAVRMCLGRDAHCLHQLLCAPDTQPIALHVPKTHFDTCQDFETPLTRMHEVMHQLVAGLAQLVPQIRAQARSISRVHLTLWQEDGSLYQGCCALSEPQLSTNQLERLLDLHLEGVTLKAAVHRLSLACDTVAHCFEQASLFDEAGPAQRASVRRAMDRIMALYEEESLHQARLAPGHPPEASYEWYAATQTTRKPRSQRAKRRHTALNGMPLKLLGTPTPNGSAPETQVAEADAGKWQAPRHVRRLLAEPWPLPDAICDELWAQAHQQSTDTSLQGPFRLRSTWWATPQLRDYYYLLTRQGQWLWLFRERLEKRWYLHGWID